MNIYRHFLLGMTAALLLIFAGCGEQSQEPITSPGTTTLSKQQDQPGLERAKAAKERHVARLMEEKDIVGVGVGLADDSRPAVIVFTARALGERFVPSQLDGVPVVERVTGRIVAYQAKPQVKPAKPPKPGGGIDPKAHFARPVPIGISIGNEEECSAGTLGCTVIKDGGKYVLSNNHVLALENQASPGSDILQPGLYDQSPQCSAPSTDVIADLASYVPIVMSPNANNKVDAALASIREDGNVLMVGNATPLNGYGTPNHLTGTPALNATVLKYGRTTGQTRGKIIAVDVTVSVQYYGGVARFVEQFAVEAVKGGAFSKAGDSGSLVVLDNDGANTPVGLLFAGGGRTTFCNDIGNVLSALNCTIDGK